MVDKARLGDFLTNIVAPGAAVIASTYGPRYAAAAGIGMNAVSNIQENKRRAALGQQVASLADQRSQEDIRSRKKMYEDAKTKATALTGDEAASAAVLQAMGIQNPVSSGEVHKTRLNEFMGKFSEPTVNETYKLIGSIAEQDPNAAISMLRDEDNFRRSVAEREADRMFKDEQRRQNAADRRMEMRVSQYAADQARKQAQENADRLYDLRKTEAEANASYRQDSLALEKDKNERYYEVLGGRVTRESIAAADKEVNDYIDIITKEGLFDDQDAQAQLRMLKMNAARARGAEIFRDEDGRIYSVVTGLPIDLGSQQPSPGASGAATSPGGPSGPVGPTGYPVAPMQLRAQEVFASADAGQQRPAQPAPQPAAGGGPRVNDILAAQQQIDGDAMQDLEHALVVGGDNWQTVMANRGYSAEEIQRLIKARNLMMEQRSAEQAALANQRTSDIQGLRLPIEIRTRGR